MNNTPISRCSSAFIVNFCLLTLGDRVRHREKIYVREVTFNLKSSVFDKISRFDVIVVLALVSLHVVTLELCRIPPPHPGPLLSANAYEREAD